MGLFFSIDCPVFLCVKGIKDRYPLMEAIQIIHFFSGHEGRGMEKLKSVLGGIRGGDFVKYQDEIEEFIFRKKVSESLLLRRKK